MLPSHKQIWSSRRSVPTGFIRSLVGTERRWYTKHLCRTKKVCRLVGQDTPTLTVCPIASQAHVHFLYIFSVVIAVALSVLCLVVMRWGTEHKSQIVQKLVKF